MAFLKACWTNMMTLTLTPNPLKAGIKLAVVRSRFQLFAACLTVIQCLKSLKCNHPMDQNPRVTPKPVIIKRTKRLPGIERNLLKIIIYICYRFLGFTSSKYFCRHCFYLTFPKKFTATMNLSPKLQVNMQALKSKIFSILFF